MSKKLSLRKFSKYITNHVKEIGAVRREVAEIQVGFNSAYVEWKAEHDATLERLVEAVTERIEEIGPNLYDRIAKRMPEEERIMADRRQELRSTLIPTIQAEADQTLQQGQELTTRLRRMNPSLDRREEERKARVAELEQELKRLNAEIRRLSGCLGVAINFFKIGKLDRQRQQTIGQLKATQEELQKIRNEWQTFQEQIRSEQEALQAQWQEQTRRVAQLQGELEYLDAETNRESLALQRATRHVIDYLKEQVPCPLEAVKGDLDDMVLLNVQTDDYQDGLGSVGSLLSTLDGVTEGLNRFNESVSGLIKEQRMHSAHLSDLDIVVSREVEAFHSQWPGLAKMVRDEGHLCANPTEFLALVRPVLAGDLSEENIKAMFGSLGEALKAATRKWR